MGDFLYSLGQNVKLVASEEKGVIIGRAEYASMSDCYLVRYKAGDGRQVENWWSVDAMEVA